MGRSVDVDVDVHDDVGSGRDLFKKFFLWRSLFQQEPQRDNVIVVSAPNSYTYTPTTTTSTTTQIITNNTRIGGRWRPRGRADVDGLVDLPAPTMPTSLMLDNDGDGGIKRVTKNRHRKRPNANSNGHQNSRTGNRNRNQGGNGQKKLRTRHRHIKKRQQRQLRQKRRQRTKFAEAELPEDKSSLAEDFAEGQQSVFGSKNERLMEQRRLQSKY